MSVTLPRAFGNRGIKFVVACADLQQLGQERVKARCGGGLSHLGPMIND
ncbi:hypothetical protein [Streptomyces sp. NRRL S-1824]|nr:hypothetical protein [Streptomyces sp. NRRL S-1824]